MKKFTILVLILFNLLNCTKEPCQIKMDKFIFPDDLDKWKWDNEKFICEDIPYFIIVAINKLNLKLLFNDKNYSILFNGRYTKFLYDKTNDLLLCVQTKLTKRGFNNKTILFIYLLDKNFLPLYSIKRPYDSDSTYYFKYFYDNKYPELYSYRLKFNNFNKKISELSYNDLIYFYYLIRNRKFELNYEVCFNPPNHKIYPLWLSWIGIN
jgi:hypothetical protein